MRALVAVIPLVLSLGISLETQGLLPAWPMYGHDARHTGQTLLIGPQSPQVAWRRVTGFSDFNVGVPSVPAVAGDGTIYIAVLGERLLAVNPGGSIKWSFQAAGFISHTSPAIAADGTVYVGASNGKLYAIEPADGTERWAFQAASSVTTPTIGRDGTIYVPSEQHGIYAVNPDGTQKWQHGYCTGFPPDGCLGTSQPPAVAPDGTVYWVAGGGCAIEPPICASGYILAVDRDGSGRWQIPIGPVGAFAPSVDAFGTVYVTLTNGWLVALRPSGRIKWAHEAPFPTAPQAIGADGTIYVPTAGGLYAVGPFGFERWFVPTAQALRDIPAIGGDGTIYVNGDYQDVYAFRPNGTRKWTYQIPDLNPAGVALGPGGRLYVGTGARRLSFSYLYAFGPR